jgi:hypothetical protein
MESNAIATARKAEKLKPRRTSGEQTQPCTTNLRWIATCHYERCVFGGGSGRSRSRSTAPRRLLSSVCVIPTQNKKKKEKPRPSNAGVFEITSKEAACLERWALWLFLGGHCFRFALLAGRSSAGDLCAFLLAFHGLATKGKTATVFLCRGDATGRCFQSNHQNNAGKDNTSRKWKSL